MKYKFYLLLFLVTCTFLVGYGQKRSKTFTLNWKDQTESTDISTSRSSASLTIPILKNDLFDDNYLPIFNQRWKTIYNTKIKGYELRNVVYQNISKTLFKKESQAHFPKNLDVIFEIKHSRDESFATLIFTPVVLVDGILKKVMSFDIDYELMPHIQSRNSSTVHDSPLSSGNWYKFAIDTTGVYRLDRSFINSLGLSTNGINPKNIKIYGNGGNMLEELNGNFRYDDIQENAIYVSGEEDNSFDGNDYILFYAQGPDIWKHDINTNLAAHQTNIYSDKAFYYITVSDSPGKRIQAETVINDPPDLVVNTSNDFRLHEQELINFDSFGQEFYGESFQIEDTQNFSFDFTDLDLTQPVQIKMKGGATASSSFSLNAEGQNILNFNIFTPGSTQVGRTNFASGSFNPGNEVLNVEVVYDNNNNPSTRAYLDYIEINGIKKLIARDKQFSFRNYSAANQNGIVEYQIENSENIFQLWNVTDRINVTKVDDQGTGGNFSFKALGGVLNEYIIVHNNDYYLPERIQRVAIENQNLHAIQDIDYLIITTDELMGEAQRLADFHEQNSGYSTLILNPEVIYNEFSSGAQDLTAIRDFIRHLYINATTNDKRIKYVLFFGDASFDFKNIEGNNDPINVPAFQSLNSFDLATSFVTDDFFGMMDDNEGFFSRNASQISDMQDVATGRMPVKTLSEARSAVDRTLNYYSTQSLGNGEIRYRWLQMMSTVRILILNCKEPQRK